MTILQVAYYNTGCSNQKQLSTPLCISHRVIFQNMSSVTASLLTLGTNILLFVMSTILMTAHEDI